MIVPHGNRERADSYLRIVSSRTADNMREFSAARKCVQDSHHTGNRFAGVAEVHGAVAMATVRGREKFGQSSIITFFAGFKWASSSLPTDHNRPRATSSRYRSSATVSLLWPSVVAKTLVFFA